MRTDGGHSRTFVNGPPDVIAWQRCRGDSEIKLLLSEGHNWDLADGTALTPNGGRRDVSDVLRIIRFGVALEDSPAVFMRSSLTGGVNYG